jgi:hypothetical protein
MAPSPLAGPDVESILMFLIRVGFPHDLAAVGGWVCLAMSIGFSCHQIGRVDCKADYVGSLVVEGETGRPTEHAGEKFEPPDW